MGVLRFISPFILRTFRFVVHFLMNLICRLTYGKPDDLPPIRNQLLLQPASVLAEKIRKKQLKSVTIIEAMIERTKEVQPFINAMVDDAFVEAVEEAQTVDDFIASTEKTEEEIEEETPLLGVPFSCKEYIAVKNLYHTNGLYYRKGVRADFDADVVQRMKKAGAICFVKTNIPELSLWMDCGNHVYGATRNPYDTRRMPGGSTGGEGALISSGGSLIGLGSDLGGSLRLPAFENGIFAHKPTAGLVPDVGTYPQFPPSIANFYSNLGPICRYASDLRPMMKILAGEKLDFDQPVDFRKINIYYTEDGRDHPLATPVIPEIKSVFQEALLCFEKKYDVVPIRVEMEELRDAFLMWLHVLSDAGIPPVPDSLTNGEGMNPSIELVKLLFGKSQHTFPALALALGMQFLPDEKSKCRKDMLKKFDTLRQKFDDILKENCVFFHLTQPNIAPYLNTTIPKAFDVAYTAIFNILGYPATQVPLRLCRGLPIGIQIAANSMQDRLTIAVAEELERGFDGWISPVPIV